MILSGSTQPDSNNEQANGSNSSADHVGSKPQEAPFEPAGTPSPVERLIRNPQPSSDKERQNRELGAYEASAAWAWWVVVVATIQALLSGIGIFFIVQTVKQGRLSIRAGFSGLRQAGRAARAAEKSIALAERSARAAEAAVKVSEDTAKNQLRAYVTVSDIRTVLITPTAIFGTITIINLGQTPAKITSFGRRAWVGPRGELDPVQHGPEIQHTAMRKKGLGREVTDTIQFDVSDPAEAATVNTEEHDFYVYGRVEYSDIYGEPHWLDFSYTPPAYTMLPEVPFVPCGLGNDGD